MISGLTLTLVACLALFTGCGAESTSTIPERIKVAEVIKASHFYK